VIEHSPELEVLDDFFQREDVRRNGSQRRIVVVGPRQLEQLGAVFQADVQLANGADDAFELFLFLTEGLCALLIIPDVGVFQLFLDFREALRLYIEVKDTSGDPRCVPADPKACRRSG
jgi:hypothetical protein